MSFLQMSNIFLNQNCLEGMQALPDSSIDLVFADLPYGTTQNSWDTIIPFTLLWEQLNRVCKLTAPMVFTTMQPFSSLLVASNIKNFKYEMVWRKNKPRGFLNAKKQPLRTHETIQVFYRQQPAYTPIMTEGHNPVHNYTKTKNSNNYGKCIPVSGGGSTLRYPTSILDIPVVNNEDPDKLHPNQKPEGLVEWFIKTYTQPGDTILDPTAGSATSLVVAKRLGRSYVGYETDLDMFIKAQKRLENV